MTNEVIYDSKGRPDIMVAFTPEELGLPLKLKGRPVEAYLISKYINCMIDGVPYSLPFAKPAVNVSHDEAIELCEAKGEGWHLLTNDEWMGLARQSIELGTIPRGNTDGGSSHENPEEKGITYEGSGRTLTGSGPITWNHNGRADGVADMIGNVWEHVGGIRLMDGQLQVIPDNEAAAGADQSSGSQEWQAIYTPDGDPIYFNVRDGEIHVEDHASDEQDYGCCRFADLEADGMDVPDQLIRQGLFPYNWNGGDMVYIDSHGERCFLRGGNWTSGASAGLFCLLGAYARSSTYAHRGFRSAYVRYSGTSDNLDNLDDDLDDAPENLKEQIRDNGRKLEQLEHLETLPRMIRDVMTYALLALYEAAGGTDRTAFIKAADRADDKEMMAAAGLAGQLAQIGAAVKVINRVGAVLGKTGGGLDE